MAGIKTPITQKVLVDWAGPNVFRDAQTLFKKGLVCEAQYDPPYISGSVSWANRELKTKLRILPDGSAENQCPCRDSVERGIICAHVIALGLMLVKRQTDPERDRKYKEELRRAKRLSRIDESEYITRVSSSHPGAVDAELVLTLAKGWRQGDLEDGVHMLCSIEIDDDRKPVSAINPRTPLCFSKRDESLLYVLEDVAEGPIEDRMQVNLYDLINILKLCNGKELEEENGTRITVNATPMTSYLHMDLDRENGELILMIHTELPYMGPSEYPIYFNVGNVGWVYGAGNFWPLEKILPGPLRSIYTEPIAIDRENVPRFLRTELPMIARYMRVEEAVTEDLFTIDPADPTYRLVVKGSPASLSATLYAEYGDISLVAGAPAPEGQFSKPDPDDLLRYRVRNMEAEARALQRLAMSGLNGIRGNDLSSIVGQREVLNFLGSAVPTLRREGWRIELEGRIEPMMDEMSFAMPVVNVVDAEGGNWFEVDFNYEDLSGESLSPGDIQRALRMGDSYIEKGGKTILLDSNAINGMLDIFADCDSTEGSRSGSFRMENIYAAFVKSSLDVLDGVDVETSPSWREKAANQNRSLTIGGAPIEQRLVDIMRSYQVDGVNWMRFLEKGFLAGIMADEMGLGKTLQALTWLTMERAHEEARDKPSLVICPTSLVENWEDEAAKFVPEMKVLVISGSDRHSLWDKVQDHDLIVTSYALLRRDLDRYLEIEFACLVLDEAQHIKNRSTQNAIAAKKVNAHHRLVLTGTPIENSVADLWSIMDFLMPKYLGSHENFRRNYELPIQNGGPEAELAQTKLRRKIHPFLLRRLKVDVAKDLPPKIEKVTLCSMTRDQMEVYKQVLEASRRKISDMVAEKGFNRSRMEILTTLMRLRQVCCHLDLLKLDHLESKHPSAKLDLFFEVLDEALDGQHRVLVFSQFVSMLTIIRRQLEERGLTYCYLDGSTKERMAEVKRFNTDRSIPVFLISLKAGGTGLNLTGADMVVHFDPWWNPAVEDQATDRAYRIGQKRTVYSMKLITRGTVEEKVLAMQQRKKAIINATLESDESIMQSMSWDDIQELLSI